MALDEYSAVLEVTCPDTHPVYLPAGTHLRRRCLGGRRCPGRGRAGRHRRRSLCDRYGRRPGSCRWCRFRGIGFGGFRPRFRRRCNRGCRALHGRSRCRRLYGLGWLRFLRLCRGNLPACHRQGRGELQVVQLEVDNLDRRFVLSCRSGPGYQYGQCPGMEKNGK